MKKLFTILLAGLLMLTACTPAQPATQGPGVATIVASTLAALTAGAPPQSLATSAPPVQPTNEAASQPTLAANGQPVSYANVSFVVPSDVATNALAGTVPAVPPTQDGPGWDVAPEYIKFQLDGYADYNQPFHDPQILVFPAADYAAVNPSAATEIQRLQALLNGSAAPTAENLPHITFFNAAQAFAAQIEIVTFQNGRGMRFVTEYAQYYVTANNRDLFYQFQGLTSDGKYYILALLPVTHPLLALDSDPASIVPAGGVTFPGYEDQTAIEAYYPAVVSLLNVSAPNSFTPSLASLDALIQSISVAP